jgi:hypothetical protein
LNALFRHLKHSWFAATWIYLSHYGLWYIIIIIC